MPKVSVLMPVYKAEIYLPEAIDSILTQTFSDFELLAVGDELTDPCSNIISNYSKKDSRIKFVLNERKGIAGALNTGLRHAKGEYIARMDADDISFKRRLEKQVCYMDRHPKIGVLGTWMNTFGDRVSKLCHPFPKNHNDIKVAMLFYTPVAHPTVMLRKDFFSFHDLKYDEFLKCGEDYDLWSRAISYFKFGNIKEVLLSYRLHPSNAHASRAEDHHKLCVMVLKRELCKIGVDPTEDEINLHMRLYWGPYGSEEDSFDNVYKWFLKLIKANKANKYLCPRSLASELRKLLLKHFWIMPRKCSNAYKLFQFYFKALL